LAAEDRVPRAPAGPAFRAHPTSVRIGLRGEKRKEERKIFCGLNETSDEEGSRCGWVCVRLNHRGAEEPQRHLYGNRKMLKISVRSNRNRITVRPTRLVSEPTRMTFLTGLLVGWRKKRNKKGIRNWAKNGFFCFFALGYKTSK